jgi:hypothetical protein
LFQTIKDRMRCKAAIQWTTFTRWSLSAKKEKQTD